MRKAQELSLNLVVVGVLALLVLVIVGGVMVFGGGDLMDSLSGMAPTDSAAITTFISECQSKCNSMKLLKGSGELEESQARIFCCASNDLDGNTNIDVDGELGPELCSLAYSDCLVDGDSPEEFCLNVVDGYDFTGPDALKGGIPACDLN